MKLGIFKKVTASLLLAGTIIGFGATKPTEAAEHLVQASISPGYKQIYGQTASMNWNLSWGGGNMTTYNVRFNFGDGNYWSDPRANYYSTVRSKSYSLGSLTTATYRPSLVVHSGQSNYQANATVYHTRY